MKLERGSKYIFDVGLSLNIFKNGIISIRREIDEDREEENRDADIKIMVFDKFPFFIPKDT